MQIMTGTKRTITVQLWEEQIEKYIKRANDSMECFRRFRDSDSLERLIEDCEKIIENANHAKEAINYMDVNNIQ